MINLAPVIFTWNDAYLYAQPILQNLALVVLCFGVAAGLKQLQKMDRKLNAIGRVVKSSQQQEQPLDLAPVAPNYEEEFEPPRQEIVNRGKLFRPSHSPMRRIDRIALMRKDETED